MLFFGMTDEGKDAKQKTENFLKKHKITWPCGWGSQVTKAYKVSGWPTLFVIGADGKVAWNDYQQGDLAEAIEKALEAAGGDDDDEEEEEGK